MPNHKSCEKKCKVNERRRKCNLERKQRYRANVRKLKKEINLTHPNKKKIAADTSFKTEENAIKIKNLLREIKKQLDKIGAKHIFHKNKVARLKSKYEKMVNKFTSK